MKLNVVEDCLISSEAGCGERKILQQTTGLLRHRSESLIHKGAWPVAPLGGDMLSHLPVFATRDAFLRLFYQNCVIERGTMDEGVSNAMIEWDRKDEQETGFFRSDIETAGLAKNLGNARKQYISHQRMMFGGDAAMFVGGAAEG